MREPALRVPSGPPRPLAARRRFNAASPGYQSDLSKRDKLAKAFQAAAEPINAKIGVGTNKHLPDTDWVKGYQAAAEAARAAEIRFKSVIITAQNTVATERKVAFDAPANDEVRKTWIDQYVRSTHGQQIITDMVRHLGGRAKTDRDKKLVKLVVAAETACLGHYRSRELSSAAMRNNVIEAKNRLDTALGDG